MLQFAPYAVFAVVVIALLAFDLYQHRDGAVITIGSATKWSLFYIAISLAFAGYLSVAMSVESAELFLTGYALEKVLAVDNLFAFMMIFSYFGVKANQQHRILYWGIIGAIIFRAIFVALGTGATLLGGFWVELIFASIIGYTAVKMLFGGEEEEEDLSKAWYITALSKVLPVTATNDAKGSFFVKLPNAAGKLITHATPLFVCLVAIELADVVFAFDSVPAVIAVTKEPFLVFAAMIFAILGLRSLYFVLDALRDKMSRLETAVIVILAFIAGKLGIQAGSTALIHYGLVGWEHPIHIDPLLSLGIILSLLVIGIVWSLVEGDKSDAATA